MSESHTVLVIDDDPDIREVLQVALEGRGYQVACAPDGEAGIAHALAHRPAVVILDLMMPRVSGFVVLERLKHHHRLGIPIIMLTGHDGDYQRAYAEFLGVDEYLTKPVPPVRLFETVGRFCPPAAADP